VLVVEQLQQSGGLLRLEHFDRNEMGNTASFGEHVGIQYCGSRRFGEHARGKSERAAHGHPTVERSAKLLRGHRTGQLWLYLPFLLGVELSNDGNLRHHCLLTLAEDTAGANVNVDSVKRLLARGKNPRCVARPKSVRGRRGLK